MVVCMPWCLRCVCGASEGLLWGCSVWLCCVALVGAAVYAVACVASVALLCGVVACFLSVYGSLYALASALRLWGF